ncbi:MAG TPA: hypothetical protein VJ933_01340, partial [Phaeodactylibacter sp.]|nr:hypothetical protein [Phaeodactylibacter sp.]
MRITICCLAALLLLLSFPSNGQSVVVNNPSSCRIGLDLTDASCDPNVNIIPDPDVVVVNVNNAVGTALG